MKYEIIYNGTVLGKGSSKRALTHCVVAYWENKPMTEHCHIFGKTTSYEKAVKAMNSYNSKYPNQYNEKNGNLLSVIAEIKRLQSNK